MENRDKIVVLLAGGRLVQRQDGAELTDEELYALRASVGRFEASRCVPEVELSAREQLHPSYVR